MSNDPSDVVKPHPIDDCPLCKAVSTHIPCDDCFETGRAEGWHQMPAMTEVVVLDGGR
jgi:hypothetical protein